MAEQKAENPEVNLRKIIIDKPKDSSAFPDFKVSDTVRVSVKIKEGENKFRLQPFEGIVIRVRGSGIGKTFTVRKISYGEGVERIFPFNSPNVQKVEILRKGQVKRSKLYYMRQKTGKAYKVEEEQQQS